MSATALYEGAIDRQELSPLASSAARSAAASRYKDTSHKSSYTSIAPMAMQKTYVLPKAVTALHKTLTSNGISNKNLLVAVNGGQIFSLDLRQIHPRRPFSDPSMTEKQEGLLRYSPYIMFNPFQAVTLNYNLPGGPVHNMISVPSSLESTALVFSFGGCSHQSTGGRCSTLDYHANRVMPSQTFDMLASDFNYELLVLILLGLAIGVMMLQRAKKSKLLYSNWA